MTCLSFHFSSCLSRLCCGFHHQVFHHGQLKQTHIWSAWSRANHTLPLGGGRRDHLICLHSIQVPVSSFPRHHQWIFITAWKNFPLWATVFRHSSRGRGNAALKAAGGDSISTWLKHFHVLLYLNEAAHIRGMLGRRGGKKNQQAIWKMIRLNLWLKLIWLRNSGALGSVSVADFWGGRFKQMPLRVSGFGLHTDYNQWIGMCVSSFYAESWSIFTVPFSTAPSRRWTVATGESYQGARTPSCPFQFLFSP